MGGDDAAMKETLAKMLPTQTDIVSAILAKDDLVSAILGDDAAMKETLLTTPCEAWGQR